MAMIHQTMVQYPEIDAPNHGGVVRGGEKKLRKKSAKS